MVEIRQQDAQKAAKFLRSLANEHRLLILCRLADGEMSVGQLSEPFSLSQSSFSQHLSVLREQQLVTYRKDAQTLYYRIKDLEVMDFIKHLQNKFCPDITE